MSKEKHDNDKTAQALAHMSDLELLEIAAREEKLDEEEKAGLARELRKRGFYSEAIAEENPEGESKRISGPLVMVKRFSTLAAASLAKSVLDSANIDSMLAGEKILGMVYPQLIGAVKLMVRPEDAETAGELLSEAEAQAPEGQEETDLAKIIRDAARQKSKGGNAE